MTKEDKDLLIKALSGRLPYRYNLWLFVQEFDEDIPSNRRMLTEYIDDIETDWLLVCKPYLRPLSSMTDEEKEELLAKLPTKWNIEIDKFGNLYFDICEECMPDIELFTDIIDWLNKKMFDFRGLIPKGHAIAVTKDNNPYKD